MAEATLLTRAKIDIGKDGVTIYLENLDTDLVELMKEACKFEVINVESRNKDFSDITIRTVEALSFVPREQEEIY